TVRQAVNVDRMRLLGAEVVSVTTGSRTLKDAVNEALRDWAATVADTHYVIGSVVGPHPFPAMVRDFQRVIGDEALAQLRSDDGGQIATTHSISAGLDYPGVGPEHAYLKDAGRAEYVSATDREAIEGFLALARTEGILPALEPAHAIGWLLGRPLPEGSTVAVCLSGRGDKDLETVRSWLRREGEG